MIVPTRLRRSRDRSAGISRERRGKGFTYRWPNGRRIRDASTRERIRALAIPPAWEDVWICPDERGHLQAAGTDGAGRRQYLYHADWRARRDTRKFLRVESFARSLPVLRDRVEADIRTEGLTRRRVLACAARLLDEASFRIGGEAYAEANGSFGLATLRRSHVRMERTGARITYTAKSGRKRVHLVRDRDAVQVIRELCARSGGGRELLAYRSNDAWRDVRSSEINAYIQDHLGAGFSAKDFRTWQATVLAATLAGAEPVPATATARNRRIRTIVGEVADHMGNTPAVCRASYIDPRVFERFHGGITIAARLAKVPSGEGSARRSEREAVERAVLDLLDGAIGLERAA